MNGTIGCSCSIADDNLCHITSFDLTRNYLNGTIPVEWASMKNLSSISLTANRLSGNIPGYLGNFTALTYLSLESNQFSGVVPPELGKLASLDTLILSSNKLVGTLPEALAQIKDLGDFRVSDNNLNGTVLEFIGNWTQLRKLRIADTPGPEFPLPIVPEKMNHLVLRNINLSGIIPKEAWDVEKTLDLTFNKLVGELPSTTIRRQFTFLSGNMLTGTVQEAFIERNTYL
ncbi:hypothetical protein SADUNF_Sadunf11G0047900 [Salix dunnii]|uniref:Uncharacterized protein n=1 Tax=Salix dunnii TaxID=1413687 RepID=A0A835JMK1_9ROSI|nr:hypothetical protein SADUNF_Sadunf11G0047900 [Salix dunnii]